MEVAIVTFVAKVAAYTIRPIGRYIVCPIARRLCPFKNLWEYESNLGNLKTEVKELEAKRESVRGLTIAGIEPLSVVNDWLEKASNVINEVSTLITEDNPEQQETGCCQGCSYSNLKRCCRRCTYSNFEEWRQHRNTVARKLKNVTRLLQEATRSMSLWRFKSNLENLKKDVEKLEAKRESVKRLIKVGEEPLPDVKLWQESVDDIIHEFSRLTSQDNPQQLDHVARMWKKVVQLLQEAGAFKKFTFRPIPEETWIQSSEGYMAFESRTSILKEIIETLSKPDVGLVGIYGMGGIGKTTLAKQVARALKDKLFNQIVFVEVSPTPSIKKVQGDIGSKLGLKFREEDELAERARRLYELLKKEENTLLIIDNIWEILDFETVGIPSKKDRKGLKLLMTARKKNVLRDGMEDSLYNFSIGELEWPDAWSLFKSKAGTCVDRPDLLDIAVDVAKECGGVPIAIVPIATTLHTKVREEWNTVFRKLKNPSPGDFVGEEANKVYQCIELSYTYLENDELKDTFLLCSRMGRTYDASIEDLLRYGIGLGVFNRFNTLEEERDNVCSLVNTLKASSLLVDAPKKEISFFNQIQLCDIERFAMHDVVCDVGRMIAKREKNVDNVIDNVIPRCWKSEENKLRNCISITLHEVNELSEDLQLECPQLKFLYVKPKLSDTQDLPKISDKFFAGMPSLQVLHLIDMYLQPLSTLVSGLVNLRTFCLEECVLKDIADIGDLKNLEILSFRFCQGLNKLPRKLPRSTKLRLLELKDFELSIPLEFILSLKKLEALYIMTYTTIKWEVEKSNNRSEHAYHDVSEHLSNLTSLEILVDDAIMLKGLLSAKLERYKITIGKPESTSLLKREGCWDIPCKTSLFLGDKLNTNEDGSISGLKAIKPLLLDEVLGIANNFRGLDRMDLCKLEDLKVQNNSHVLHIVDTVSYNGVFPILKSLILENLMNLKSICNGPLGREPFHQLRTIRVRKCNELINVFSFVSERVFQELEEIEVLDCENMEGIFAISEQVHEIKFSKLRILRLSSLPQLESLCYNVKTTTPILPLTSRTEPGDIILEEEQDVSIPLFNKVAVTNLETLKLVKVNVKIIWDNQLPVMSSIQNLTCLIISNLANLRSLGSGEYIKFPSLKKMRIESCSKFKEFIFDDKGGVPNLEELVIADMDNLKMIWHNQLAEDSLPKLKSLQVLRCRMLSTLLRSSMCGSFLSLQTLNVTECGSLKEIFVLDALNFEERHLTISNQPGEHCTSNPQVLFSFANLQALYVSNCQRMKNLFYAKEEVVKKEAYATVKFVFPKLITLLLYSLPELRTFFPGRYTTEWPVLQWLYLYDCGTDNTTIDFKDWDFKIGKIWPNLLPTISSWVQNLTKLIVYGCDNLEELFPYSMTTTEELREKKMKNTISFPKLQYLSMKQLANLKVLSSGCHVEFPTLKKFKIRNCPELTAFIFSEKIRVPKLEEINISSMDNLEMIWHNQVVEDSTPNLNSLHALGCHKLLSLFRSNVYGRFLSLKNVIVSDCGSLEEIFNVCEINFEERQSTASTQSKELCPIVLSFEALECLEVSKCESLKNLFSVSNVVMERLAAKEAHATAKFVFPKLISLNLYKLPQLRTFYPARCLVEWPNLIWLHLRNCGIPNTDDEDQMQHPLFIVKKAVPYLERLILAREELTMMWQGSDPERPFRNLKILCVYGESKTDYWPHGNQPTLQYMENVEYTSKDNFTLHLILPLFKEIVVHGCDSFISQMPPSASFQCLTSLVVYGCNRLEHIGTSSMAENLVKLVHLTIDNCEKVVEVVGNHGYVTGGEILFSYLKSLSLRDLPSFTSFCSWNFTLKFPSLEELRVFVCPNMEIFSQGDFTTPKLREFRINSLSIGPCPNVDVNTAIQEKNSKLPRLPRPRYIIASNTDESEFTSDESE